MKDHFQLAALAAACVIAVSGCGGGRTTHPVSGKVALADGQPLAGARVVFDSVDKGVSAQGYTDEAGQYRLTTEEDGDGAVPGEHRVIVMPPPRAIGTGEGENVKIATAPARPVVPKKLQRYETSGLTFEVQPGDNTYDIVVPKQ
jgi:hypothetical protein